MQDFDLTHSRRIIKLQERINKQHKDLRTMVSARFQAAECGATGGLNTNDYIDAVEVIADKRKNLVKAGSYKFIYNPASDRDPLFGNIEMDYN